MTPSFNERRAAVQDESQKEIAKALTADRQARNRVRELTKKKADFAGLSEAQQTKVLEEAEAAVMAKRVAGGIDAETKRVITVDKEVDNLQAINDEEMELLKATLGAGSAEEKGKKRALSDDDDDDNDKDRISKVFKKNMTPVIEKLERQIIAGGELVVPGATAEDLDEFARQVSNPQDIEDYIEKWGAEDADITEGLDEKVEEVEDGDIEVVVSDDEEIDSEEDEDNDDFIVADEEDNMEIDEE